MTARPKRNLAYGRISSLPGGRFSPWSTDQGMVIDTYPPRGCPKRGISHNIHYFPPYPFFIKKTKGPKIWDVDGNEYIDLWMGNYTHILGHRSPVIVHAIEKKLKEGIHWGLVYKKQIEWAELVQELVPSAERVRFCCSGTEATMYAVRLARGFTGKKIILKIAGGWHGANPDLSLGIKMPYEREESLGLSPDLHKYTKAIPFNDLSGTLKIIHQNKKNLAGIMLEPIVHAHRSAQAM